MKTKEQEIKRLIKTNHFHNFDEIAKIVGTSRIYVLRVFRKMNNLPIKHEILDAPKFWNPEDVLKNY